MEIKRICQIYFSPTGTTEKVVQAVSAALADDLDAKSFIYDFTLPQARTSFPQLAPTDLVLFGCPTYAGRLPNLLLKCRSHRDLRQPRLRQFPHRAAQYP